MKKKTATRKRRTKKNNTQNNTKYNFSSTLQLTFPIPFFNHQRKHHMSNNSYVTGKLKKKSLIYWGQPDQNLVRCRRSKSGKLSCLFIVLVVLVGLMEQISIGWLFSVFSAGIWFQLRTFFVSSSISFKFGVQVFLR